MQESSWVYLGTVQITLVFIKMQGKPLFGWQGSGIRDWEPYPSLRGRDSIVNIRNWDTDDTISHIAPCEVMVIRIFRLLNDPNNLNFQKDFHDLTTPRNCERGMHTELQLRLHNCPAETNHNSEDFPSKAWVIRRLYILIISKIRLIM